MLARRLPALMDLVVVVPRPCGGRWRYRGAQLRDIGDSQSGKMPWHQWCERLREDKLNICLPVTPMTDVSILDISAVLLELKVRRERVQFREQ
jgi:hypothetical protein